MKWIIFCGLISALILVNGQRIGYWTTYNNISAVHMRPPPYQDSDECDNPLEGSCGDKNCEEGGHGNCPCVYVDKHCECRCGIWCEYDSSQCVPRPLDVETGPPAATDMTPTIATEWATEMMPDTTIIQIPTENCDNPLVGSCGGVYCEDGGDGNCPCVYMNINCECICGIWCEEDSSQCVPRPEDIPSTTTEVPSTSTEIQMTTTDIPITTTEMPTTTTEMDTTTTTQQITTSTPNPEIIENCLNLVGIHCTGCFTIALCNSEKKPLFTATCPVSNRFCNQNRCSAVPVEGSDCTGAAFLCTSEGYFPDPDDCSVYYYCPYAGAPSSEVRINKCEGRKIFSIKAGACRYRLFRRQCGTVDCRDKPNQFVLLGRNTGYYAFCSAQLKATIYKCPDPDNMTFNVRTFECEYRCRARGYFPDSLDCRKYYFCHRRQLRLTYEHESCPAGYKFEMDKCVVGTCDSSGVRSFDYDNY